MLEIEIEIVPSSISGNRRVFELDTESKALGDIFFGSVIGCFKE